MAKLNNVNIGSGTVLLNDGAKSPPEPMLTYQQIPATSNWGQFH